MPTLLVFGARNLGRVLAPGRAFYVWCGAFPSNAGAPANTESFPRLFRDAGMLYAHMLVWDKGHGILGRKDFMTQYEALGHMTPTKTADSGDASTCFLPHHGARLAPQPNFVFNGIGGISFSSGRTGTLRSRPGAHQFSRFIIIIIEGTR